MYSMAHTKPNLLVLEANYDNKILDCSILPITDFVVIDDFSSSDLKSIACTYFYRKNTSVLSFKISPRFWSCLKNEILRSYMYRYSVWRNFQNHVDSTAQTIFVKISLTDEPKCSIDYRFGTEVQILVNERVEMDYVMSCLSTLGGAFSSLGDQFTHCAQIAGNISAKQYKIALKLGDPVTLLRCKLYYSISLIQCGHLKNAKDIIQSVYNHVKSIPEDLQDKRIIYMCQGIWAKLRYTWHQKIHKKSKNNNSNSLINKN